MTRGSDIAARLPATHTLERERLILQAVKDGEIVPIRWAEVPLTATAPDGTVLRGRVYVAENALRLGEPGDAFLPNTNHVTAQLIVDALEDVPKANAPDGVVLPTARIVDAAKQAATVDVPDPCTQPPDAHMGDTARMLEHSRCIERAIGGRCGLASSEGKTWRNTNAIRGRPRRASNYGMFAEGARYRSVLGMPLWQPAPGTAHISGWGTPAAPAGYTDYSQVLGWVVRVTMWVEGEGEMSIHAVARHPVYSLLISTEGPLSMRHPAVPEPGRLLDDDAPPRSGVRPATPVLTRTLRVGMRGQDVAFVQRLVGAKDDGIYGPKTKAAVAKWQSTHVDATTGRPLAVDGVVGPRTRKAMLTDVGTIAPVPEDFVARYDPHQAEFVEAKHYNRWVERDVVHWLVLHSAEAGEFPTTAEALARYAHTMPDGRVVSWHWAFDVDSATRSVPESRIAYHAKKANRYGVGYEQAGYARQSRQEWLDDYSESMLWIMATTAAKITMPSWDLPRDNVVDAEGLKEAYSYINQGKKVPDRLRGITTHDAVSRGLGGSHTDPGADYPMDKVLEFIKEAA